MRLDNTNIKNRKRLFDCLNEISKIILSGKLDNLSNYSTELMDEDRKIPIKEFIEDYPNKLYPWCEDINGDTNYLSFGNDEYEVEAPFCELENGKYIAADIQMIIEYNDASVVCDFLRVDLL